MGLPNLDAIVLDYIKKHDPTSSREIAIDLASAAPEGEADATVVASLERLHSRGQIRATGRGRRWFGITAA